MNLIDIVSNQTTEALQKASVVFITAESDPGLLFSYVFKRMAELFKLPLMTIDAAISEDAAIRAALEVSFLGSSYCYLIKNLEEFSPAQLKTLISYLEQYKGPHKVIVYCKADTKVSSKKGALIIKTEDTVDAKLYTKFYEYIHAEQLSLEDLFVKKLFSVCKTITLDEAYMMITYQKVLGKRSEEFFDTWLPHIIMPDLSLFTLSQYFFAKDQKNFSALWQKIHDTFPDEFWTSYWSDQLWNASVFVQKTSNQESIGNAKTYRLPFSFMQRDYKRYALTELAKAHSFLYSIDYNLKNGSGYQAVDLFCAQFINGEFRS
jgi:hypothetical protein